MHSGFRVFSVVLLGRGREDLDEGLAPALSARRASVVLGLDAKHSLLQALLLLRGRRRCRRRRRGGRGG